MTEPIRAEDVTPERVEWLWRDRIPRGMIAIVAGKPDQGKGLLCCHIAAEVSKMKFRDPSTGQARKGKVLYSAIEDSHGLMTRPRLEAAGADLNQIYLWRFQIPSMQEELEYHVVNEGIDLVVIDPLAASLSGKIRRTSDNIREVLNPLSRLIEQTGTSVIMVEHVLKRVSAQSHPLAAIGGSGSGVIAASRMAFIMGTDPDDGDKKVMCCVKHNITNNDVKALSFEVDSLEIDKVGEMPALFVDDEVTFDPMRLLTFTEGKGGRLGRPPDKRAQAAEWLTNYLYEAGDEIQAGKVFETAKQYKLSAKTLRRAADDVRVIKNPPGGGRNCKWSLPDETIEALDEAKKASEEEAAEAVESVEEGKATYEPELPELSDEDIAQLLQAGPMKASDVEPGEDA